MKEVLTKVIMVLSICGVFFAPSLKVYADNNKTDIAPLETLMTTCEEVDALAEPYTGATVVFSYGKEQPVQITGKTTDGWYQVSYQGNLGYIQQDKLKDAGIDMKALQEEMENMQIQDKLFIEEVERLRAERKRSIIWGVVIVGLVIAIFALGIVSSAKADKKKKNEEIPEEEQTESNVDKQITSAKIQDDFDFEIIDIDEEDDFPDIDS